MTRTKLALLIFTAATLSAAGITPSFAERNTGAFDRSNEGTKLKLGMGQVCADLAELADKLDTKARNEAVPDKNTAEHQAARTVRNFAGALGCKA